MSAQELNGTSKIYSGTICCLYTNSIPILSLTENHIHRAVNPPPPADDLQAAVDAPKDGDHHHHEHGGETHSSEEELHYLIGVALVTGFVFMLLVDQIGGGHAHSHGQQAGKVMNDTVMRSIYVQIVSQVLILIAVKLEGTI